MFLLSWNVAGWPTTACGLRSTLGSVAEFFRRTGADVICIQEAKVSRKKLAESPRECGACDTGNDFDEWESFWSCSETKFNGVATFVRRGFTSRADAKPFGSPEFDSEGRCIVTYHSNVVIFNVYVPFSRDEGRHEYKTRFLAALREAMGRARRESGLPVILCGDLNASYKVADCHFSHRRISLCRAAEYFATDTLSESKAHTHARLLRFLRTSETVRERLPKDIEADALQAMTLTDFERLGVKEIWADVLMVGKANEGVFELTEHAGLPAHDMESKWLGEEIIHQDGMVDSLLAVHGHQQELIDQCCPCPFTCWNQHHNCRYQNEGTRIDYILVDKILENKLQHHVNSSSCPETAGSQPPLSLYSGPGFKKSVRRVTQNGRFSPVPTTGGGLEQLNTATCELLFNGLPRTGLIITPPQLSDHIAVCCLLDMEMRQCSEKCVSGGCQYKPCHPSIKDFFMKKKLTAKSTSEPVGQAIDALPTKKQRVEVVVDE
jgi:exodeoxyribonuclease III